MVLDVTIGVDGVVTTDPASLRNLTNSNTMGVEDWHPEWTPDGQFIAFNRRGSGSNDGIFQIRADGTGLQKLAIPSVQTYSPDGQYIATSTADLATRSQSIMLVPVAGGEPVV